MKEATVNKVSIPDAGWWIRCIVSGVLGGLCVSIGGTIFLLLDNKMFGALMFTTGLYTICVYGLNLFTGKICYIFDNNLVFGISTIAMWIGNWLGAWGVSALEHMSRISPVLTERATALTEMKMDDSLLSLFILGIFCNLLIYIGVDNYLHNPHEVGKYLGLLFGITVFVLCGFEHCVADSFYFSLAGVWGSGRAWVCIFFVTLGNAVGGLLLPVCRKWINGKKQS